MTNAGEFTPSYWMMRSAGWSWRASHWRPDGSWWQDWERGGVVVRIASAAAARYHSGVTPGDGED